MTERVIRMLKEGKGRVSSYRVVWIYDGNHDYTYWQALNAQQAVDFTRQYSAPEGAEIIEVSKVVNNWK